MKKPRPPKKNAKRKTGGGKATSGGVSFQAQVAAWIAVHALARQQVRGAVGGAKDCKPRLIAHETGQGVDDLRVDLEPHGRLFLQATTNPSPDKTKSFLQQAFRTWNVASADQSGEEFTPPLSRTRDALVLIIPVKATKTPDLLHAACRRFDQASKWNDAGVDQLNAKVSEALTAAKAQFVKLYAAANGRNPTDDELVELFALIRVVRVHTDQGEADQDTCVVLLQNILVDPAQAHNAWNWLVVNALNLMKLGSGADRGRLADKMGSEGFPLKESASQVSPSIETVSEDVKRTEATVGKLVGSLPSQQDDDLYRKFAEEKLTLALTRTRQRAAFSDQYCDEISALAERCIKGDFTKAPPELRFRTIVFAARVCAGEVETKETAKQLLAEAGRIYPSGSLKLAELTLLGLDDIDEAIRQLREIKTPEARSQLFLFLRKKQGPEASLEWVVNENLTPTEFNAPGALNVAMTALTLDRFDFAAEWLEKLPQQLIDESPALQYTRAQTRLASTIPADQRPSIFNGLPRHLRAVAFFETAAAKAKQAQALADFKEIGARTNGFELAKLEQSVSEFILWLEMIDPATAAATKDRLTNEMRDPVTAIPRMRLALSYRVDFDHDRMIAELQRRRKLGGWTAQEALAALLLAQHTSKDYSQFLRLLDEYREDIEKAEILILGELDAMQVEALARNGSPEQAQQRLTELGNTIPQEMAQTLAAIIAGSTEQIDDVERAERQYKLTNQTEDLVAYCHALSAKKDFKGLVAPAKELAERTKKVDHLVSAANALHNINDWRGILELQDQLADVGPTDSRVLQQRAEAFCKVGNVVEARTILDTHFAQSADPDVVQLDTLISIESGDWGHLQGIIDRARAATDSFTPIELARLARLALVSGSTHAVELMNAALKRAGDDPNIYLAAYMLAMERGVEDDESHAWFNKAIELSGEDGPIERKSLKDIADMAPAWREREDRTNKMVREGNAPLFVAARTLNQTLINATLGRALNNLAEPDATRRSPILAFDGARLPVDLSSVNSLALDVSGLMTLALLHLLPKVLAVFPTIVIGANTLMGLFEERQRIRFHQPSRVTKAQRLKKMIDDHKLVVIDPPPNLPAGLVSEVGDDLAALLVRAREAGGYVVHPGPLHKVGLDMETDAIVGDHAADLTDTLTVLNYLTSHALLTATVERDATLYIGRVDEGLPTPHVIDPAIPVYLDDLAISYLDHTNTLLPFVQATGRAFISRRTADEINALLSYQHQTEDLLNRINKLASDLWNGIKIGKVIINERRKSVDEGDEEIRQSPTLSLLQSMTPFQAVLIDDKALNRYRNWVMDGMSPATASTVDLLPELVRRGKLTAAEQSEALRVIRAASYGVVPTTEEELLEMLAAARIKGKQLIETREMVALRESIAVVAASRGLRPNEDKWLPAVRMAILQAIRKLWSETPADAGLKSTWLLSLLPSLNDHCPLPITPENWETIRRTEAAQVGLFLNPLAIDDAYREAFNQWVTANVLEPLVQDDPERLDQAIDFYKSMMKGAADGQVE